MKILITGTAGFIAGRFLQYVARNHPEVQIYAFDKLYQQDLRNPQQLEECIKGKDLVYHLAALTHIDTSITDPLPFLEVNIMGTYNVLQACTKYNVPLVYMSSSEVHGTNFEPSEQQQVTDQYRPHSPYGASKACGDLLCSAWFHTYGTNVRVCRAYNVYGPGQDYRKVIPWFLKLANEGKPLPIHGDGLSSRDWVYVDDVVEGLWLSQKLKPNETVALATGEMFTILQLVAIIKDVVGNDLSTPIFTNHTDDRAGQVKHLRGSYQVAHEKLGWYPKTSIAEGLKFTWQWLKINGDVAYRGGEDLMHEKPELIKKQLNGLEVLVRQTV